MRKLREVLRLHYTADLSIRQISASTKISVGSIQNILKLAKQHELDWPLPDELDDQALALKLFPQSDAKPSSKLEQPVWPDVHRELKKKGVTKQLLWDDCRDAGGRAMQEQLPRNTVSSFRTGVTVIRSSAPAIPTG
jgi:transposase